MPQPFSPPHREVFQRSHSGRSDNSQFPDLETFSTFGLARREPRCTGQTARNQLGFSYGHSPALRAASTRRRSAKKCGLSSAERYSSSGKNRFPSMQVLREAHLWVGTFQLVTKVRALGAHLREIPFACT